MKGSAVGWSILAVVLMTACDAAEGVRVQSLPSLDRPSPEARLGLPEVAGAWRFAGWEIPPADSALLAGDLPSAFGEIRIETQRLDSIGGSYSVPGANVPLVGEVRRDSVVALVAQAGPGGRFLAGRVSGDTLWVSMATLLEPGVWPGQGRAAFVRSPVPATFARLEGQPTILPGDTVPPMLAGMAPPGYGVEEMEVEDRRVETAPRTGAAESPPAAAPTTRPAETPEQQQQRQEQQPAAPPAARPAQPAPAPAEPREEPAPRRPRLLGTPVDTVNG
ncbi:hypothetical protein BH23GEM6_BH23GEM6_05030 [soil metagenome]